MPAGGVQKLRKAESATDLRHTQNDAGEEEDLQMLKRSVERDIAELKEACSRELRRSEETRRTERNAQSAVRDRMLAESGASLERHVTLLKSINTLEVHLVKQPAAVEQLQSRVSVLEKQVARESAKIFKHEAQLTVCRSNIHAIGQKVVPSPIHSSSVIDEKLLSILDEQGHAARLEDIESRLDSFDSDTQFLRTLIMERCAAVEAFITKCSQDFVDRLQDKDSAASSSRGTLPTGASTAVSGGGRQFAAEMQSPAPAVSGSERQTTAKMQSSQRDRCKQTPISCAAPSLAHVAACKLQPGSLMRGQDGVTGVSSMSTLTATSHTTSTSSLSSSVPTD